MLLKKTVILAFAILYGLFSLLLFSDNLLLELIEVKKAYYLEKNNQFEEITFTLDNWTKLENKKEFKIGNKYYDVKKIKIHKNKVTATVINDEYENIIKYVSKNLFPKDKKNKTSKNKRFQPVCILESEWEPNLSFEQTGKSIFFHSFTYFRLHSQTIYRPPCMYWI